MKYTVEYILCNSRCKIRESKPFPLYLVYLKTSLTQILWGLKCSYSLPNNKGENATKPIHHISKTRVVLIVLVDNRKW